MLAIVTPPRCSRADPGLPVVMKCSAGQHPFSGRHIRVRLQGRGRPSQLHAVLDVLRNEKPLVVYYESATNAALRSGVEPIGEEEGTGKP